MEVVEFVCWQVNGVIIQILFVVIRSYITRSSFIILGGVNGEEECVGEL